MKKYEKPVLELKTIAISKGIASGLDGWIEGNNLSNVGIITVDLHLANS